MSTCRKPNSTALPPGWDVQQEQGELYEKQLTAL